MATTLVNLFTNSVVGYYTICTTILKVKFCVVRFLNEVKQLSSWKFFDWNRFGNRISIPKCNHSNFGIIF